MLEPPAPHSSARWLPHLAGHRAHTQAHDSGNLRIAHVAEPMQQKHHAGVVRQVRDGALQERKSLLSGEMIVGAEMLLEQFLGIIVELHVLVRPARQAAAAMVARQVRRGLEEKRPRHGLDLHQLTMPKQSEISLLHQLRGIFAGTSLAR